MGCSVQLHQLSAVTGFAFRGDLPGRITYHAAGSALQIIFRNALHVDADKNCRNSVAKSLPISGWDATSSVWMKGMQKMENQFIVCGGWEQCAFFFKGNLIKILKSQLPSLLLRILWYAFAINTYCGIFTWTFYAKKAPHERKTCNRIISNEWRDT